GVALGGVAPGGAGGGGGARARDLVAEVEIRPVIPPGTHPDRRALARASQSPAPEPAWTHAALVTAGGRAPGAP
ncbi:hypothetical protein ACWGKX_31860, partial [Streptomyces tricolor]